MLRARPTIALVLVPALLLAACGSSGPSSDAGASPTQAPVASSAAPSASEPAASEEPSVSEAPASEEPTASDEPSPSESEEPSAEPTTPSGAADACTVSVINRDANLAFFVSLARSVTWPLYCAVLPTGWTLTNGTYRLANGGLLLVSYKGPNGATLALSEGTYCTDGSGCVPAGTDAGDAVFGPMDGTLVALDDGGFAIVVNRGGTPSWLLEAHGIDEATTRSIGEALFEVAG